MYTFQCVGVHDDVLCLCSDAQMEGFGQFRKLMEESCIKLRDRLQIHSTNMTGREYYCIITSCQLLYEDDYFFLLQRFSRSGTEWLMLSTVSDNALYWIIKIVSSIKYSTVLKVPT